MNKENSVSVESIYSNLEKNMVRYENLIDISVTENGEEFVSIPTSAPDGVIGKYLDYSDMSDDFPEICIRRSVRDKLANVNQSISGVDPNLRLMVTYGFRSLEVQKKIL